MNAASVTLLSVSAAIVVALVVIPRDPASGAVGAVADFLSHAAALVVMPVILVSLAAAADLPSFVVFLTGALTVTVWLAFVVPRFVARAEHLRVVSPRFQVPSSPFAAAAVVLGLTAAATAAAFYLPPWVASHSVV
jgi:hypothetical protein